MLYSQLHKKIRRDIPEPPRMVRRLGLMSGKKIKVSKKFKDWYKKTYGLVVTGLYLNINDMYRIYKLLATPKKSSKHPINLKSEGK